MLLVGTFKILAFMECVLRARNAEHWKITSNSVMSTVTDQYKVDVFGTP